MPLRDALVRLVAGIVEPKRIGVIGFPLDDVTGVGGRNLPDFAGVVSAT